MWTEILPEYGLPGVLILILLLGFRYMAKFIERYLKKQEEKEERRAALLASQQEHKDKELSDFIQKLVIDKDIQINMLRKDLDQMKKDMTEKLFEEVEQSRTLMWTTTKTIERCNEFLEEARVYFKQVLDLQLRK